MDKDYVALKKQAEKLRKEGLSYGEIKKAIEISKSTLSFWLKTVPLKPAHRERLYTKQVEILSRGAQSQKERRRREIEEIVGTAKKEVSLPLSQETYRLFGAALYWAEGSKTKHFEITNSDPHLITFMARWFIDIFHISPTQMKAHLNIYPQQDEAKLKKFWSDLSGIPIENFGKSFVKPLNKGYKKNNLYYGTIKMRVSRGTDMRHRVFGWITTALQSIEPKVQLTQRKWVALKNTERPPANLR